MALRRCRLIYAAMWCLYQNYSVIIKLTVMIGWIRFFLLKQQKCLDWFCHAHWDFSIGSSSPTDELIIVTLSSQKQDDLAGLKISYKIPLLSFLAAASCSSWVLLRRFEPRHGYCLVTPPPTHFLWKWYSHKIYQSCQLHSWLMLEKKLGLPSLCVKQSFS